MSDVNGVRCITVPTIPSHPVPLPSSTPQFLFIYCLIARLSFFLFSFIFISLPPLHPFSYPPPSSSFLPSTSSFLPCNISFHTSNVIVFSPFSMSFLTTALPLCCHIPVCAYGVREKLYKIVPFLPFSYSIHVPLSAWPSTHTHARITWLRFCWLKVGWAKENEKYVFCGCFYSVTVLLSTSGE